MVDGHSALSCDFDGTSLTLFGPTDFDFVGEESDEFLDADLFATLTGA